MDIYMCVAGVVARWIYGRKGFALAVVQSCSVQRTGVVCGSEMGFRKFVMNGLE